MNLGLQSKVALITGGARGLGRAIAEKLAAEKATIVITDINDALANATAAEIAKKYPIETLALKHDVASEESTKEVIKTIVNKFSRIDILINNAGITRDARLMMMKQDDWDLVLRINLTGAFICSKLVSIQMLKQNRQRLRFDGQYRPSQLFGLQSRFDWSHQNHGPGNGGTRCECKRSSSRFYPIGYDPRPISRGHR
jgi:NAD(P)-dependent dehydrogenase (short-subunit alcohol dehydrogenase family)